MCTYHSTSCCDRSLCVLFTDYPAVKRVCSQIPGTWYLVPGAWYQVPGTRYQVPRYPGISSKPTGSQYLTKSMIYSRKIEVFKCQYAHFAHIRLSFGCTDEKMDCRLYLHTSWKLISYCQKIIAFFKKIKAFGHMVYDRTLHLYIHLKSGKSTLRIFLVTFCQQNHFFARNPNVFLWSIRSVWYH